MPNVSVPDDTFRRLAARAAALNISVDDLVKPALDRVAEAGLLPSEPPLPLNGDAWQAELEAWKRDAESRAGRYPPGFVLDDSRETIYREREDAQLILVDTNILLRYARTADPAFATVDTSVNTLHAQGEVLCVVPQDIYEFWATATRPIAANGLGLSVPECQAQVVRIKRLFRFLPDVPTLFAEWEALVVTHACHGRASFDARLVAAMRTHGIARLLTLNRGDFTRFPGLSILDPTTIAAAAAPPPSTTP